MSDGGQAAREASEGRLAASLAVALALMCLGIVSGALVARTLGVESRGVLAAVTLWPAMAAYLGDLGVPTALAYAAARGDVESSRLPSLAITAAIGQALVVATVATPIIAFVLSPYGQQTTNLAIVYLWIFVPINFGTRYLNAVRQGHADFKHFNSVRLVVQLAFLLGLAGILVLGLVSVAAVAMITLAANIIALAVAVGRTPRSSLRPHRPGHDLRALLSYGIRAHIGTLTPIDSMQLDMALVIATSNAQDSGLYAIASSAGMVVRAQGSAIGMVALPTVARLGGTAAAREAGAALFRVALIVSCTTSLFGVIIMPIALPMIYGEAYAASIPLAEVLIVAMAVATCRQVLGDVLRGMNMPGRSTGSELVGLVCGLIAVLALVPNFGLLGYPAAAMAAYAGSLASTTAMALRAGFRARDLFLPRRSDLQTLLGMVLRSVSAIPALKRGLRSRRAEEPSGVVPRVER